MRKKHETAIGSDGRKRTNKEVPKFCREVDSVLLAQRLEILTTQQASLF
jgi:hypothetical protein